MCLMIGCGYLKIVSVAGESESADRYLSKSGMSVWAIETLDRDVRQYIADELRNSGGKEWKAYTDIQTVTVVNSEQDGVSGGIGSEVLCRVRIFHRNNAHGK